MSDPSSRLKPTWATLLATVVVSGSIGMILGVLGSNDFFDFLWDNSPPASVQYSMHEAPDLPKLNGVSYLAKSTPIALTSASDSFPGEAGQVVTIVPKGSAQSGQLPSLMSVETGSPVPYFIPHFSVREYMHVFPLEGSGRYRFVSSSEERMTEYLVRTHTPAERSEEMFNTTLVGDVMEDDGVNIFILPFPPQERVLVSLASTNEALLGLAASLGSELLAMNDPAKYYEGELMALEKSQETLILVVFTPQGRGSYELTTRRLSPVTDLEPDQRASGRIRFSGDSGMFRLTGTSSDNFLWVLSECEESLSLMGTISEGGTGARRVDLCGPPNSPVLLKIGSSPTWLRVFSQDGSIGEYSVEVKTEEPG